MNRTKKSQKAHRTLRLQVSNEPFEIQREMIAYIFLLHTRQNTAPQHKTPPLTAAIQAVLRLE
jgi:hypothetical protein